METSFDIVRSTIKLLKGKFAKAFIGTLVYLTPLLLLCLIPYVGWIISVLLFGHLTIGLIKYLNQLFKDEDVKLYTIFELRPNMAAVTLLGAIVVLLTLLGTLLFIIPGLVFIAFYSMSLFVLEQENSSSVLEILRKSSQIVKGHKMHIVSYKIIYYAVYALFIMLSIFLFILIEKLYLTLPIFAVALAVLLAVLVLIVLSLITTYYASSNLMFYNKITEQNSEVKKEAKAEEKKEEVKETKNVDVQTKPATKVSKPKQTTKKTTTTKPKTTTNKTKTQTKK